MSANSLYVYSTGYVAQIVDDKLRPVVRSKMRGLLPPGDGQDDKVKACKSMILNYLEQIELNGDSFKLAKFGNINIPKTIEEILA